jgi:hypothetical protein
MRHFHAQPVPTGTAAPAGLRQGAHKIPARGDPRDRALVEETGTFVGSSASESVDADNACLFDAGWLRSQRLRLRAMEA